MKHFALLIVFIFLTIPVYTQDHKADSTYFSMSIDELMNIEVTTASMQTETMSKTPVPVTVITREMIDAIGARNIKEVLTTYVPGITAVEDHNEMNISMRGIYASAQQKILFLLNGHRLNSRSYSMSNPDYSINLDKIKQIEVLRGPGSSLYGNVSLTAVVNIKTLPGEDISGTQAKVAVGSNGQKSVAILAGTKITDDKDLILWGHFYDADGEQCHVNASEDYSSNTTKDGVAYLGSVQGNYDVGVQTQLGKFDFLLNLTRGKIQQPFSDGGGTGEIYNRDDYDDIFGEETGLSQEMTRLKVGYTTDINKRLSLDIDLYGDKTNILGHLVVNPVNRTNSVVAWLDRDIGGIAQMTYSIPKGTIHFGTQIDWMNVYDSFLATSTNGTGVLDSFLDTSIPLLEQGEEIIYSTFFQTKYNLANNLLLNAGLRYDIKKRQEGQNVEALSPRIALIYEVSPLHNVKFSYSKSFVDAPYWYRYNSLPSYTGSRELKPENLNALQLTLDSKLFNSKALNNFNIFYQSLNDFIFRDLEAELEEPRYRNAGTLSSWGVEEQVSTKIGKLDLLGNVTCQHAIRAKDYETKGTKIANIPSLTLNIIGTYNLSRNLFVNTSLKYLSKQYSPITALGADMSIPDHYIDAAFIINAGVNYSIKDLVIDLRIKNLLDTEYHQGGSTRFPYPQEGRWLTATLQYTFRD